jgi:aryl-alcohol dehydrogenase-like predicted oxidoreductase/predicted dehydrogenase
MAEQLHWGVWGSGPIAEAMADGIKRSRSGQLVALRNDETLLADPRVQVIYLCTPAFTHFDLALKIAHAKKHLLIETPIGLNFAEAMAIVEAARGNQIFLMEAFFHLLHPQTAKLPEVTKSRSLGEVKMVHATFTGDGPGEGILEAGCRAVSICRRIAGAANDKEFENPTEVKAVGNVQADGGCTTASFKFPGGLVAQCAASENLNHKNIIRIFGTDGSIMHESAKVIVHRGKNSEEISVESTRLRAVVCDLFAENMSKGYKAANWDDTLGNIRAMDQWRNQIGLIYEAEKLSNLTRTATGFPLAVRAGTNMKYGTIAGIDKQISRIGIGTDFSVAAYREGMFIFDDFFERGGNLFDTAWIYGGKEINSDLVLGHWMKSRGIGREQVVILGKGAHTPLCNPRSAAEQLRESLQRLGVEYLDIFMLHRDNPDVAAGEFIDMFNEQKNAGRIKTFGASNWSIARIEQANEYAAKKGVSGFTSVSNNFSLAEMVNPPWAGCMHSSDAASRAWFAKNQMTMIPWSSQARGFFLPGNASPKKKENAEMVRCWYSDENFQRLARVNEMAKNRNVSPINIALAYVLAQPFPTFPLIGPRQMRETRSSLAALEIELSPADLKWLNLEE